MKTMFTYVNNIGLELPIDCIMDCSHQGQCDDDVSYWLTKIYLPYTKKQLFRALESYGFDDLESRDLHSLKETFLWTAACNARDEIENGEG